MPFVMFYAVLLLTCDPTEASGYRTPGAHHRAGRWPEELST